MSASLPYGRQSIAADDLAAVLEVLQSAFLTNGPKIEEFEHQFAARVGAKHAIAVNSATSALHLAMRSAGIGVGDRILTSPNTFLATANCAAYVGARPDFSDIDPVSHNLDPEALQKTWTSNVRAVIAVDYAGQPCDLPAIAGIAREKGALVIDDASHAVGSAFMHEGGRWSLGGNPWADMTIFSFHPVKTMTTGEGGMLVTDNLKWATLARKLRSHGVERRVFEGLGSSDPMLSEQGPWYYEMQALGYNFRLTDLQCALGISQLRRLDDFIARRREIVGAYNTALAELEGLQIPGIRKPAVENEISWHLYTVEIDYKRIGKTRTRVMAELGDRGVGSQVHYIPIYLQPWYRRQFGYQPGKCPTAESYYRRTLSLPLFPAMTSADVERVIEAVQAVMKEV